MSSQKKTIAEQIVYASRKGFNICIVINRTKSDDGYLTIMSVKNTNCQFFIDFSDICTERLVKIVNELLNKPH